MTVDPSNPHDSLVEQLLAGPARAAAVLQTLLPPEIACAVDRSSLRHEPGEMPTKGWKAPRSMDELLARPLIHAPLLARYLPRFDLLLVDLSEAERDQVARWARTVEARGAPAQAIMLHARGRPPSRKRRSKRA